MPLHGLGELSHLGEDLATNRSPLALVELDEALEGAVSIGDAPPASIEVMQVEELPTGVTMH